VSGANRLKSNSRALNDGASQLATGIIRVEDGAGSLEDATQQVTEGIGKLDDGAGKLSDGQQEFYDDGIRKLEDELTDRLDDTVDRLKALQSEDVTYNSFSGKADDMESNVKFIIETTGIEKSEA
jgi:putative membrane protein